MGEKPFLFRNDFAGARTDSDSCLPTMVTPNLSTHDDNNKRGVTLGGVAGSQLNSLQHLRSYPAILPGPRLVGSGGSFGGGLGGVGGPKARGRPRGSLNKMYAGSREYMAIARVLNQYKQQLKQFTINKIKSQYKVC